MAVYQRMKSGRLKIFPSLTKLLEELRLYRRDENNQVVNGQDQLMDALRCLVIGLSRMRTKPPVPAVPLPRCGNGPRSWM